MGGICVEIPLGKILESGIPHTFLLGAEDVAIPWVLVPTDFMLGSDRVLETHLPQVTQNSGAFISGLSSAHRLGFFDYFEILPFITCNFREEGKALVCLMFPSLHMP